MNLSERNENYLLFVPSLMSRDQVIHYKVTGWENEYLGMQTNEAVTKYLIDYLESKGAKLDKIIMLCSDEVKNQELKLDQVSGRTTLEYYKGVILDFYKSKGCENIDAEGLFEIIPYIPKNDGEPEEIVEPLKKVLQITGEGENVSGKHLFVDFTGGLRSAALLLLFACRILQKRGVEVEKILYSQIYPRTDQGALEECTKTYRLFGHFEAALAGEYGDTERLQEEAKNIEDEEERKMIQEVIKLSEKNQTAIKRNQNEESRRTSKEVVKKLDEAKKRAQSPEVKRFLETIDKTSGREAAMLDKYGSFGKIQNYMEKGKHEEALKTFREEIMSVLYDAGLLELEKSHKLFFDKDRKIKWDVVTNELMGAYCYYENPGSYKLNNYQRQDWHTFMDAVRAFIGQLCEDTKIDPEKVMQKNWQERFYSLNNYLKSVPKRGFAHNSFSRRKAKDRIVPYLRKDNESGKGLDKVVEKFMQLDTVYMCYGFPFACTYDRSFFDQYDHKYRKVFENGANSLHNFYLGKADWTIMKLKTKQENFTYESLIQTLAQKEGEELLRILFPFQLVNIKEKSLEGDEWEAFIYQFARSFYVIKNARNKLTHAKKLDKEEFELAEEELKTVMDLLEKHIKKDGK